MPGANIRAFQAGIYAGDPTINYPKQRRRCLPRINVEPISYLHVSKAVGGVPSPEALRTGKTDFPAGLVDQTTSFSACANTSSIPVKPHLPMQMDARSNGQSHTYYPISPGV